MQYLVENSELIKKYENKTHKFAKDELNWDIIVEKLNKEIEKRRNKNGVPL